MKPNKRRKPRKRMTEQQREEQKRLSAPTFRAKTGYGDQPQVERPEQLNKPTASELRRWERKLPRAIE